MKYLLIVISILLTACASTMPPMTASECAEQHRRLVEQQNQLKLRKAIVEKQVSMLKPGDLKYSKMQYSMLVEEFNNLADKHGYEVRLHNSRCVQKN